MFRAKWPASMPIGTIDAGPTRQRGKGGFAADYYGIFYHGVASTHIDALCHTWDAEAMWNGRDPRKEITFDGATFGSIEHWADGILTRGVMLDVPRHRGVPCVTQETPVHGWELEDILTKRGITLEPGDAGSGDRGRATTSGATSSCWSSRPSGSWAARARRPTRSRCFDGRLDRAAPQAPRRPPAPLGCRTLRRRPEAAPVRSRGPAPLAPRPRAHRAPRCRGRAARARRGGGRHRRRGAPPGAAAGEPARAGHAGAAPSDHRGYARPHRGHPRGGGRRRGSVPRA